MIHKHKKTVQNWSQNSRCTASRTTPPRYTETKSLMVKVAASGQQLVGAEEVFQDVLRLEVDRIRECR